MALHTLMFLWNATVVFYFREDYILSCKVLLVLSKKYKKVKHRSIIHINVCVTVYKINTKPKDIKRQLRHLAYKQNYLLLLLINMLIIINIIIIIAAVLWQK